MFLKNIRICQHLYIILPVVIFTATATLAQANWIGNTSIPENDILHSVIFEKNQFVAIGDSGLIMTSADGNVWVAQKSGTSSNLLAIAFGRDKFVAIGDAILTSSDGVAWSVQNTNPEHTLHDFDNEAE